VLIESTTSVLAFLGKLSADWRFLALSGAFWRFLALSGAFWRFLAAFWQLSAGLLAAFRRRS